MVLTELRFRPNRTERMSRHETHVIHQTLPSAGDGDGGHR